MVAVVLGFLLMLGVVCVALGVDAYAARRRRRWERHPIGR